MDFYRLVDENISLIDWFKLLEVYLRIFKSVRLMSKNWYLF